MRKEAVRERKNREKSIRRALECLFPVTYLYLNKILFQTVKRIFTAVPTHFPPLFGFGKDSTPHAKILDIRPHV